MLTLRYDWTKEEINQLMETPFISLLFKAQTIHQQTFNENDMQLSVLLSIKTGACPEDCSYCPQSGHYHAKIEKEKLYDVNAVLEKAKMAKAKGASRFCMGAAWRSPPKKAMPKMKAMIEGVKQLGLETCMTLGMLDDDDAKQLAAAGLDYYNHNIDTSPEYYDKIIKTRTFNDRLDTLEKVRKVGVNVCCGGIIGLGESREDRVSFLHQLATMAEHPQSVPINRLIAIKGTPLEKQSAIDNIEFVKVIATARILMPKSYLRLSAGRADMSDELHALCFMAGANSIFLGDKLLTANNPDEYSDENLMEKLGIKATVPMLSKNERAMETI